MFSAAPTPISAVVFDVGETLVDESHEYGAWADWLGVPRHTFSAVFGGVIRAGRDYREAFEYFRPGFDLPEERRRRALAGQPETFSEADLYPDARPCLEALRAQGLFIGLAGNQTARAETVLRGLDLPVDLIATSDGWGVEKPAPAFFDRVVAGCGRPAANVLYVGDRLDNDVLPARAAGMRVAHLRRGPWGYLLAEQAARVEVEFRLTSLAELPTLVTAANKAAAKNLAS